MKQSQFRMKCSRFHMKPRQFHMRLTRALTPGDGSIVPPCRISGMTFRQPAKKSFNNYGAGVSSQETQNSRSNGGFAMLRPVTLCLAALLFVLAVGNVCAQTTDTTYQG